MKKYLAIILAILTFAAVFPPIVGSAAALLEKHFGIGSADIALSKNYNPDDNTVIIKTKRFLSLVTEISAFSIPIIRNGHT